PPPVLRYQLRLHDRRTRGETEGPRNGIGTMHTIAMTFWSGCVMMLVAAAPLDQTAPRSDELTLASPSFEDGEAIPLRHTAYGENLSPPLSWTGIPADVGSYAVVVEDSDAPGPLPFVHWVLYNIPGDVSELPEGIAPRPM